MGYLVATVISYLALRTEQKARRYKLARVADVLFLASLTSTAAVALFMTFAPEG